MTLSDAIRIGAMLSPQGFDGRMDGVTRCALAAASDAIGLHRGVWVKYGALIERFPILTQPAIYPCGCHADVDVESIICHLNDTCHWSREAIADWVQTLEQAQAAPAVEVTCSGRS